MIDSKANMPVIRPRRTIIADKQKANTRAAHNEINNNNRSVRLEKRNLNKTE